MQGGKQEQFREDARAALGGRTPEEVATSLRPAPGPYRGLRPSTRADESSARRLWKSMGLDPSPALLASGAEGALEAYARNIENCIGTVRVPIGVAGPLRVRGLHARGDYFIPLATTEAALVASYHRGAMLIGEAGGCTAILVREALSRVPVFLFENLADAGRFLCWTLEHLDEIKDAAEQTGRHVRLRDVLPTLEGNHIYLGMEFLTGDASGQNMVTLAAQAACDYITGNCPIKATASYTEGNMSGDKKASARAFVSTRGKKVTAEVLLPGPLLEKFLHVPARALEEYWRVSALGGVLSGTMGVQGHFANGLAALYLATGQDVACVAESAVGITRFEAKPDGSLYAAVTLPGIMVGTVGGGTGLPGQRACLELMGLAGDGHARALAEVCAGLLLAGELSIIGALAAGEFTRAHRKLARDRSTEPPP
jgi:hydroxymethylglutaryl-CoA reductase (NADPH)